MSAKRIAGRALNESFKVVLACLQLPTKIKVVECNISREQTIKRHNWDHRRDEVTLRISNNKIHTVPLLSRLTELINYLTTLYIGKSFSDTSFTELQLRRSSLTREKSRGVFSHAYLRYLHLPRPRFPRRRCRSRCRTRRTCGGRSISGTCSRKPRPRKARGWLEARCPGSRYHRRYCRWSRGRRSPPPIASGIRSWRNRRQIRRCRWQPVAVAVAVAPHTLARRGAADTFRDAVFYLNAQQFRGFESREIGIKSFETSISSFVSNFFSI